MMTTDSLAIELRDRAADLKRMANALLRDAGEKSATGSIALELLVQARALRRAAFNQDEARETLADILAAHETCCEAAVKQVGHALDMHYGTTRPLALTLPAEEPPL